MRKMVLILSLLSATAWAKGFESIRCESKEGPACYRQVFPSTDVYKDGVCYDNIYRLTKVFKNSGIDLSRAQVLYISRPSGKDLDPDNARKTGNSFGNNWSFHVVLVHDGRVYDLSHSNEARITPYKLYFESAFPGQDIQYKSIPADVYADEYEIVEPVFSQNGKKSSNYFRNDPANRFPVNKVNTPAVGEVDLSITGPKILK